MLYSQNPTILLIEDNGEYLKLLRIALISKNYSVYCVQTSKDAIDYLSKNTHPQFIVADRTLDGERIEIIHLERIARIAKSSYCIVYSRADDLKESEMNLILSKGAVRVLARTIANQLAEKIEILINEFEELIQLSESISEATQERKKILSALVGTDSSIMIIDEKFKCWYSSRTNFGAENASIFGLCWENCHLWPFNYGPCWGCVLKKTIDFGQPTNSIFLHPKLNQSLIWNSIHTTPIKVKRDNKDHAIAASITVTENINRLVNELSLESRLEYIVKSLIYLGFGRVRLWEHTVDGKIRIKTAYASVDESKHRDPTYFQQIRNNPPFDFHSSQDIIDICELKYGKILYEWKDNFGKSDFVKSQGIELPLIIIPIRSTSIQVDWLLCMDFVGVIAPRKEIAINKLCNEDSLKWIAQNYQNEIINSFKLSGHDEQTSDYLRIVHDTKIKFHSSRKVEEAIEVLKKGYELLLPSCRISIRILDDNKKLIEYPKLCVGERPVDIPEIIDLEDPISILAQICKTGISKWIDDYSEYYSNAKKNNEPEGYGDPNYFKSTADIPLQFELEKYGTLHIDSPQKIDWDKSKLKEFIFELNEITTLLVRDTVLNDQIQQLMEKNRLHIYEKEEILKITAHEIRGPIQSIQSSVDLLDDDLKNDGVREKFEKRFAKIKKQLDLLKTRADLYLTMDNLKAGHYPIKPSLTDLEELGNEIINDDLFEKIAKKKVKIDFKKKGLVEKIILDSSIYRQIIYNLLSNSIKYSKENSDIYLFIAKINNHIIIIVKDYGVGIPEEDHENIFKSCFRSVNVKHNTIGSGIGLTLVDLFLKVIKGKVTVKSKLGHGTTMKISISI